METVPFEDELDIVNDYLALEQARHEERLRSGWTSLRGLPLRIPPMLLQTLVENAVKYGYPRPKGEISIVARNSDGALRIQVSSPGENRAQRRESSTGRAANAAERLRLIFGAGATWSCTRTASRPIVAERSFPCPFIDEGVLIDDERLARNELRACFPRFRRSNSGEPPFGQRASRWRLKPDCSSSMSNAGETGMDSSNRWSPRAACDLYDGYDEFA